MMYLFYLHINHIQNVQRMGEHELSTYQSGFTQSHANLVSTLTREPSPGKYNLDILIFLQLSTHHSGASVPRPLYFEVPCSPSGAGPLVGRGWVWHEAATQLFRPPQLETSCSRQQLAAGRGVLITGGPGAGKTAAVLALVQASCFGQPQSGELGRWRLESWRYLQCTLFCRLGDCAPERGPELPAAVLYSGGLPLLPGLGGLQLRGGGPGAQPRGPAGPGAPAVSSPQL